MTAQEYIKSGILEAYATGQLSEAEMAEVEQFARAHPEVQRELDAILSTLNQYAAIHDLSPNPATRERVLASVQSTGEPKQKTEQRPVVKANTFWPKVAVAASVLLLVSLIGNILMFTNLNKAMDRIARLETEQDLLVQQYTSVQTQYAQQANLLETAIDPDSRKIRLAGTDNHPEAEALVVWNPATQTTYLIPSKLPPAPRGKQYQLWSLKDGQPRDAGLLALETAGPQRLSDVSDADMFAITLEPEGGSQSPTLDQLIVAGTL